MIVLKTSFSLIRTKDTLGRSKEDDKPKIFEDMLKSSGLPVAIRSMKSPRKARKKKLTFEAMLRDTFSALTVCRYLYLTETFHPSQGPTDETSSFLRLCTASSRRLSQCDIYSIEAVHARLLQVSEMVFPRLL